MKKRSTIVVGTEFFEGSPERVEKFPTLTLSPELEAKVAAMPEAERACFYAGLLEFYAQSERLKMLHKKMRETLN